LKFIIKIVLFFSIFKSSILFSQEKDTSLLSSLLFIKKLDRCLSDERIKTVLGIDILFDQRWYFENDVIAFCTKLQKSQMTNEIFDSLFWEIGDSSGNIIKSEEIEQDSTFLGKIFWKVPLSISSGWYFVRVRPCSISAGDEKEKEKLLFTLLPKKRFYIFNKKDLPVKCCVDFFSEYSNYKLGIPFQIKITATNESNAPIGVSGYLRNKNFDSALSMNPDAICPELMPSFQLPIFLRLSLSSASASRVQLPQSA